MPVAASPCSTTAGISGSTGIAKPSSNMSVKRTAPATAVARTGVAPAGRESLLVVIVMLFFQELSNPLTNALAETLSSSGCGRSWGWIAAVTVNPWSSTSTSPATPRGAR